MESSDNSAYDVSDQELITFVVDRDRLSADVAQLIRAEREKPGTRIHTWFVDFQRKLDAKPVDWDWDKIHHEIIRNEDEKSFG